MKVNPIVLQEIKNSSTLKIITEYRKAQRKDVKRAMSKEIEERGVCYNCKSELLKDKSSKELYCPVCDFTHKIEHE